jgi:hypothetical protein
MSQFPEEVLKKAFARANARCQCEREGHAHSTFTCFKQIEWKNRGVKTERSGWEARYMVSPEEGGKPTVENCEILCWDCYTRTTQSQQ